MEFKPFKKDDFSLLLRNSSTPEELMQWAGSQFVFPLTEVQLDHYLADHSLEKFSASLNGGVVGHFSLKIDDQNRQARIGRVLIDPKYRGQGLAKKMFSYALNQIFNEMKMHKVTLGVFEFNQPAIRCYETIGFQRDGVLRDHRKVGDDYWNLIEMSLLESEWT